MNINEAKRRIFIAYMTLNALDASYLSPNFIAEVMHTLGVECTSEEIVYIHNSI